jgi:hypothetical protein
LPKRENNASPLEGEIILVAFYSENHTKPINKLCRQNAELLNVKIDFIICTHPQISLGECQVKSRRMRWAGHVARMGEERKVYKVLVGKPEG